jgi:hypothetical protein
VSPDGFVEVLAIRDADFFGDLRYGEVAALQQFGGQLYALTLDVGGDSAAVSFAEIADQLVVGDVGNSHHLTDAQG